MPNAVLAAEPGPIGRTSSTGVCMGRYCNALLFASLALVGCSSRNAHAIGPNGSAPDAALAEQADADGHAPDAASASVVDLDGGNDGARPSAIVFATVEGEFTCADANTRIRDLLSKAVSDNNACTSDEDCVCANADTECDSRCEAPVSRDRLSDFRIALDAVSSFFLPPVVCPCGQSDVDCSTCGTACVAGRCTYARINEDESDAGAR